MHYTHFTLDPEPKDNEVWIYFGLASYYAQVLEKGLLQFLAFLKMLGLSEIKPEITEEIFGTLKKQTMGQLLDQARQKAHIPHQIDELLSTSLAKRNFLAHRFFDHYALDHVSKEGRAKMIDDLQRTIIVFKNTDKELSTIVIGLMKQFGITEEKVENEYHKILKEYDEEYRSI